MKYIVYKTTCLVNSKIYIGYHQTSNPEVFDGYLGCGLYKQHNEYIKHPKTAFHHAVVKYGVDNFKREILYVFDNSKDALAKEAELVTAEFVRSSNNYNSSLGGEQPINPGKKIYRFNFQGDLIETFNNANIAAEAVYRNVSNIHAAIQNKRTCAGSLWSNEEKINIEDYKITEYNTYYIYDQDGYYLTEFSSNEECVEFLGTDKGNLTRAIKLQNKISGYYITTQKVDRVRIQVTPLNGKLNRYTLDGKYIDSFESAAQAKRVLGLKLASISQAIRLNRQCNGFRWTRTDNPTETIDISH